MWLKYSRGFTLVELMVTIAVMAIIAMMAAPSFGNLMLKQNLNRSTQDLLSALSLARSKAVLERRDVTVSLFNTTQNNKTPDTITTLYWMPQGKTVLKTGSPTSITFQLSGGVKSYDANIKDKPFKICEQTNGKKSREISVSLMGTVQVVEGTCS